MTMGKQDPSKPDPLIGAGPFKTLFELPHGLASFFENRGDDGIRSLLRNAENDQKITPGKWLRSGYANVNNTGAGKLTRDILNGLLPLCAAEIVPEIFGTDRSKLLELDDRDLGKRAKQIFREMGDPARVERVAAQLLGNCDAAAFS